MSRQRQLVICNSICGTLAAIFFAAWYHGNDLHPDGGYNSDELHPKIVNVTVVPGADSQQTTGAAGDPPLKLRPEKALSNVENKAIDEALSQVLASVQKMELKNKVVLFTNNNPDEQVVMMRIMPPSAEQSAEIYKVLSQALKAFPESPARTQLLERATRLISQLTSYPKEVKILNFIEHIGGEPPEFFEWFVANQQMLMPDSNGCIPILFPPKAVMRYDGDFGGPNSWAAKRYLHLFSFDNKPVK